jgi:hypothetical protein
LIIGGGGSSSSSLMVGGTVPAQPITQVTKTRQRVANDWGEVKGDGFMRGLLSKANAELKPITRWEKVP